MFQDLYTSYNDFHVKEIITNRFQPETYHNLLDTLLVEAKVDRLGESVQGREIRSITIGTGPVHVLFWTQMHGNESTASRAVLDIFNYHKKRVGIDATWNKILASLTIKIIPILNPDGTAVFTRRNALDIDLNRDARQFISPEAKILRNAIADFKPEIAFNLHDQRRVYNIGATDKTSTISFLAPAYNEEEEVNPSRLKAMQLIAELRNMLETVVPGQVGLYNDSYSPRAFGDYAQGQGAGTILIESGWAKYDMEKEFVRKLNACMLICALESIADQRFSSFDENDYRNIPLNTEQFFDVLIRNVSFVKEQKLYQIDIGIDRSEISLPPTEKYYSNGIIADFGDLKEWYGFEEVVGDELLVEPGKVLNQPLSYWNKLEEVEKVALIKEGYLFLNDSNPESERYIVGPINIISTQSQAIPLLKTESNANFLLINKTGEIKYIVLNGFLWPVHESLPDGINGLIIS